MTSEIEVRNALAEMIDLYLHSSLSGDDRSALAASVISSALQWVLQEETTEFGPPFGDMLNALYAIGKQKKARAN